jgi:hypothetical protein
VLRHRRWGGTEEQFPTGGKYVHPTRSADPNAASNQAEGPGLMFYEGRGSTQAMFDRIALVAEPIAGAYPPIPEECAVDELGHFYGPNPHTPCSSDAQCQGARVCVYNAGLTANECVGYAGAACCAHASPGACTNDGQCSACNPHGGDGHTFRMRSKLYPTMYVVPSTLNGAPVDDGTGLVMSNAPEASGAAGGSLLGAWTMIEKPDHGGVLATHHLRPDGCACMSLARAQHQDASDDAAGGGDRRERGRARGSEGWLPPLFLFGPSSRRPRPFLM